MNEITLSVDLTPALTAFCARETLTDAGSQLSALTQPSTEAVAAFQSAMSSLVVENREVQVALEKIVPLAVPDASSRRGAATADPLASATRRDAAGTVTPEAVRAFAEAIAPLVAENREVQVALEKIVPLPLEVPVPEAKPLVASKSKSVVQVTTESKPVVATESKPVVQVTPEAVRAFAEAIAPLVAENREVQVALEKAMPLPLEVPEMTVKAPVAEVPTVRDAVAPEVKPVVLPEVKPVVLPEVKPVVTPDTVRKFAETIAPLVAENREVQVALEKIVPLPLEVSVPEAKPLVASKSKPVVQVTPESKPVVATESKPVVQVTPEAVRAFAEAIAPLVAENREVQVALEKAVPLPLKVPVPVAKPAAVPVSKPAAVPVSKPAAVPVSKPAAVPVSKPALEPEATQVVADKDKVRVVDQPDAGIVMQATPVVTQPQVDVSVHSEASQAAVDGVSSVVASQRSAPTSSEVLIAAAEAVADTIMVTPGLLSGEGRIHVQLKPDVLGGTEIQLNITGRTIAVEFQPQTVEMEALIQRSLPQLEQHLAAKIHSFAIAATVRDSRRRKV